MTKATRFFILLGTLAALAVFTITIVGALFYSPQTEVSIPELDQQRATPLHQPVRLIVPSLMIDAAVQHVGVTAEGNMAVPSNFSDVGWYKYGVVPGGAGSSVLAGHVDNGLRLAGVFKRLNELQEGDEVVVERADGERVIFVVIGQRTYPYNEVPTEIIFNPSGSPRLNLITCEGAWVQALKTYDERLVIFTKLK